MYFAWATIEDDDHHGSTKLHMDLTDAMNKMLWGANGSDGQPGPALWHLFDAVDAPIVRKFLKEDCDFQGPGDAVHSQTVYLTPDKRKLLFEKISRSTIHYLSVPKSGCIYSCILHPSSELLY